jgi:dTDP-4-dehydrorhamnose 3,5-epimerase-like enzyme
MHLHRRQTDIWHFVSGSALVRLRYAWGEEDIFRADAGVTIAIPPDVFHGFYTEEGCTLLYALTQEYDGTDEYGVFPFDGLTDASHPGWPRDHIGLVMSERDLRAPRLSEFEG